MKYYLCKNEKCARCGEKEDITRETFKFVRGRLIGEHSACPVCGQERECVDTDAEVPLSEKQIYFAEYSSKSPEEKRESLRRRSHEHFEKHVKERKDHLINAAVKEMKGMTKPK